MKQEMMEARLLRERDEARASGDKLAQAMAACAKDSRLLLWPAIAVYMQETNWNGPACGWIGPNKIKGKNE